MLRAAVLTQEEIVAQLEEQNKQVNNELNIKNKQGIMVLEAMGYKVYLKTLESKIKEENRKLNAFKESEEEKKRQMIEAKQEVASLDKLKEKRVEEYRRELQKSEEIFVEEFVSNRTHANG